MTSSERKAQKSFELRDSRDMLEKLRWEMSNLDFTPLYAVAVTQYHAFNCAVTAWHVTDWLWQDISSELKTRLSLSNCKDLQDYVREACPALNLCHQIANGSKHCLLEHKPDSTISAVISDGEQFDYGNALIVEGQKSFRAYKVFYDALVWFETFLREESVFPEEPFVPRDDEKPHPLGSDGWLLSRRAKP